MTTWILSCERTSRKCVRIFHCFTRSKRHCRNTWLNSRTTLLVYKDPSMNNNGDSNSRSSELIRMSRTRQYRNASQRALEAHTQWLAHPKSKVTMVDRGGHKTPGHRVNTSIYIYHDTIYSMLHITHVNTPTFTHTLLSRLLLG